MTLVGGLLMGWAMIGQDTPALARTSHREIPCWSGVRTWTAPGEPLSGTIVYDTDDDDAQPFLITHNRDQIRDGERLVQDYNFIDYWFGARGDPIRARQYLRDDQVMIDLPVSEGARLSLQEARKLFLPPVLCYLQKRFDRIEVLVEGGYEELWSRPR